MLFKTLIFKTGFSGATNENYPHFAVAKSDIFDSNSIVHYNEPKLFPQSWTLEGFADSWKQFTDENGKNMQERLLTECEMITVKVIEV